MKKAIRNGGGDRPPYKDNESDQEYKPSNDDEDEDDPPAALLLSPHEYARFRKTAGNSSGELVSRPQTRSRSAHSAKKSDKHTSDDDLEMTDAENTRQDSASDAEMLDQGEEKHDDDEDDDDEDDEEEGGEGEGGENGDQGKGEQTPASKHPASPQVHPESEERKAKKSKISVSLGAVLSGGGDLMEIESPSPDQLRGSLGRINPAQRAGRNVDNTYLTREPAENLMDFGRSEWEDGSDGEEIR